MDPALETLLALALHPRHGLGQALHRYDRVEPGGRPALEGDRDRVVDRAPVRVVWVREDEPEAAVTLEIALVLLARVRGRIRG